MPNLLLTAVLLVFGASGAVVQVPRAPTPIIDGRLGANEWDGAAIAALEDGTRVLLQHDGVNLYVALHAAEEALASICLLRGDRVEVLHASMALARATYQLDGDTWLLDEPFAYEMREADFSPATVARREAYFELHAWLANTTRMGDTRVREYRISRAHMSDFPIRIAVAFHLVGTDRTGIWSSANDDCSAGELVRGETPRLLHFQPAEWIGLTFGEAVSNRDDG